MLILHFPFEVWPGHSYLHGKQLESMAVEASSTPCGLASEVCLCWHLRVLMAMFPEADVLHVHAEY